MPKKLTTEEFIKKSKKVHGNKYDYSKSSYVNARTKLIIICRIHGEFFQNPRHHIIGSGCPICVGLQKTTESFINEAENIHGNKYDYSYTNYKSSSININIGCKTHGIFSQKPATHLRGGWLS